MKEEKKIRLIVWLCFIAFIIILVLGLLIGKSIKDNIEQENFEEAYILAIEDTIDKFKSENPGIIQSVTYDISFYEEKEVEVDFYVQSSQDITNASYVSLFFPEISGDDTYGKVYINGKLKYTKKASSPKQECSICGDTPVFSNGYCEECFNSVVDWIVEEDRKDD